MKNETSTFRERYNAVKPALEKLVRDYRTENYFSTRTAIGSAALTVVGSLAVLNYAATQSKTAFCIGLGSILCSSIFSFTRLAYDFFHVHDFYNNLDNLANTVNKVRGD